jgi:deazaflavin-dependent oxidoreductase (nitroreductase family)
MAESIADHRPGRALRFGLRLPIWLYRLRLGWLLGHRFLMLTHTGRKSGKPHHAVIEVVRYDKDTDTYYVVSGWGKRSDWYQNLIHFPNVTIQVGTRKFHAMAEFIPLEQSAEILETYAREHALAFRELSGLFLGKRMEPNGNSARRLAAKMPMVAFRPITSTQR